MTGSGPHRIALAWAVHGFTASGALLALLALAAIGQGNPRLALLWLMAALVVDGIDGTLARMARVKHHAARIDGDALDLVVDYLTYVFVPAVLIWRSALLPPGWALPLAGLIMVSALYTFARRDMKTEDQYFRGFPALWNLVAFYFLLLRPDPALATGTVLLLALLTFVPIHVVHPFRVRDFQPWLMALALVWAVATAGLLSPAWGPAVAAALRILSLSTAAVMMAMGLVRTIRGPTDGRRNCPRGHGSSPPPR